MLQTLTFKYISAICEEYMKQHIIASSEETFSTDNNSTKPMIHNEGNKKLSGTLSDTNSKTPKPGGQSLKHWRHCREIVPKIAPELMTKNASYERYEPT
jgi:hypothetical protein